MSAKLSHLEIIRNAPFTNSSDSLLNYMRLGQNVFHFFFSINFMPVTTQKPQVRLQHPVILSWPLNFQTSLPLYLDGFRFKSWCVAKNDVNRWNPPQQSWDLIILPLARDRSHYSHSRFVIGPPQHLREGSTSLSVLSSNKGVFIAALVPWWGLFLQINHDRVWRQGKEGSSWRGRESA